MKISPRAKSSRSGAAGVATRHVEGHATNRRTLLKAAAGFGLAAPVLGGLAVGARTSARAAQDDPLPSFHDGAAKQAILDLVRDATEEGGADFVPPEQRIATFDQDGTLWVEQPIYTQAVFALAPRQGDGPGPPGLGDHGAVQDRVVR
jgi:hypothetical protein